MLSITERLSIRAAPISWSTSVWWLWSKSFISHFLYCALKIGRSLNAVCLYKAALNVGKCLADGCVDWSLFRSFGPQAPALLFSSMKRIKMFRAFGCRIVSGFSRRIYWLFDAAIPWLFAAAKPRFWLFRIVFTSGKSLVTA